MSRERLVLAFGGGKGGVGKSLVCSAVATALAQRGLSVVALDADLGAANLHTLLGLVHPSATLDDFFSGRVSRLDEICLPTDIDGLRVISGAAAILRAANPRRRERTRLLTAFFELDADVLLLDLGAGTQSNTLDLFNLAGEGLIVTGTEPTAIQNAYAFIKAALFRALTEVFRAEPEALALVERAVLARGPERIESVERLLSALDERSPVWAERAAARVAAMQIRLVVNQAAPRDARRVLGAIGVVCQRYLGLHLPLLGALPPDATVGRAVHRMAPVMLEDPESPFALAVHALVSTLLVDARRTRIDDVMGQFEFDPPAADEVVPRDGDRPDSLGEALRAAGVAQPGSHGTRAGGVRSTGGSQPALHVGPAAPAPQAPGGERPEASAAVGATEHIAGPIMADASPEPVIERLSVVSPEPGQAPVSAVVGSPAAPESVVEAAPAVVLELVPESALEPETAPEPAPDPASEPEPDPEPAVTALAQAPEPASEPEPDPEPTVTGTAAPPEPVAVLAPAPEPASEPEPNPEPAVTGTAAPAELAPEGAAEPSDALAGEWALELAPETPARLETAAASETMVGPPLQDASPSSVEPEMLAELSESAPPIEVQPWDSAESAFETAAAGDRATALDESSDALIALESTETVGAAAPIPGGLNDPSPGSGGAPDEPTASASTAAAATPPSAAPTPDETHSPAGTEWHRPPEDAANADPRPSPFHEADVLTAGDEPGLFTESADSDVLVALADTSSGGADPEAPATPLAPNGGAGSASALDDWAASLLAVAGDLGLEDQSGPDGDDPWRSPDDDPLDAATNRLDGRHRPRVLPTAGHDPEADGAQDEEAGPTEGSLPFAAEEESLDWSASDPNEGPVFIPEAFSETLDGPVVARVEGASGNDGHLEDEPRPASPPAEASAPSIGERPTGSVDRSLRAAGFPPMPEFEDQRSPLPVVADVPAADADDWLAGFSLDTLDPDPELEPARSWAPLESVAAPTAPVGVPATEQEGGSVPEPDAEPLAIDWSDVRSSLPPPESETVRIPASTVAAMFGADNDGVEEAGRGPTHPSGPSTARTDPAATDFEEPDEWSGWGALADELHGAPEPGEPRLDAPERAAGPVVAPVPAPLAVEPLPPPLGVASLDWPEFGAPRAPAVGPDPALPTLPPRAPVPVMRPTLPALPRVRTSAPGAPGGRSQPVLPGLTPGLAAALAREVAAETMPVGEPSWSDDDDPWGSAELASGHHDPSTLGPNDPRGDRGHFGIGFDQAVSSPDGWVQVVTNDLAPLRSAVRQIVLHGGKTMHVLEQTYAETTPGAIAQRVERTHADLVARVERGGLAAVRAGE